MPINAKKRTQLFELINRGFDENALRDMAVIFVFEDEAGNLRYFLDSDLEPANAIRGLATAIKDLAG